MIVAAVASLPARGARVVCDTDSSMSGSRSSSALTRLVLPAPEGAQTMKRLPVIGGEA